MSFCLFFICFFTQSYELFPDCLPVIRYKRFAIRKIRSVIPYTFCIINRYIKFNILFCSFMFQFFAKRSTYCSSVNRNTSVCRCILYTIFCQFRNIFHTYSHKFYACTFKLKFCLHKISSICK